MLRRLMGRGRSRVSVRMTLEPSDAVPLEAALAMTRFPRQHLSSPDGQCHSDGHPRTSAKAASGLASAQSRVFSLRPATRSITSAKAASGLASAQSRVSLR